MSRLVVAFPAGLHRTERGTLLVDEKLRLGLRAYRRAWQGDVALATPRPEGSPEPAAGTHEVDPEDLGVDLVTGSTWSDAVATARPDLLLAPLIPRVTELTAWLDRAVLVAEFTPEDLAAADLRGARTAASRARVRVGAARRRRLYEALVREARGVQCNGHPAHDRFRALSPAPLLFFDTRLTAEHVSLARRTHRDAPARAPHLCFSGRLVPAKGPDHALAVLRLVRARGVDATLTILGHGPLEEPLRATAPDGARLTGSLPFADQWTRFVREEVDLMVLPHVQGDPSGTYLEAAGCGVPVTGFDNVALASLVERHGVGLTAPLDDDDALADVVARVLEDPARWRAARDRGLSFMADHHFEAEMQRRVEHLDALATRSG